MGAELDELEEQILVRVTTMSGAQLDAEVPKSCKLGELKREFANKLDIAPFHLALVSEGEIPEDDSLVCDCGVSADWSRSFAAVVSRQLEVSHCLKLMQDEQPGIRAQAVRDLGALGDIAAAASDTLEKLALHDKSRHVKLEAVWALGEIGTMIGHRVESTLLSTLLLCCKTCTDDPHLHKAVQEAFVRIGGPAVPFLVQMLWAETSGLILRLSVIQTLGKIGVAAAPAMPDLERILASRHASPDVHAEAATAIGKMGKDGVPVLGRLLRHWDRGVCQSSADAIADVSDDAVSILMSAARDTTCVWRPTVTTALGQLGSDARCGLEQLARSSDASIGAAATSALGEIGSAASIPVLEELLLHGDWDVRVAATEALGMMGIASVATLAQAIKIEYWAVHDMLLRVLEEMGPTALPLLESTMLGPDLDLQLRVRCVDTLGKMGPGACTSVPALVELLTPATPPILMHEAAAALAKIGAGSAPAAAALADVLGRPDMCDHTRELAVKALVQLGEAAVEPLARCLESESFAARKSAAFALGRVGVGGVAILERALAHPEASARQDAACSLGGIGPYATPRACSKVALLLLRDADPWVRYEAAVALGRMGQVAAMAPAVAALVEALGDCNHCTAAAAAQSLGEVGMETGAVVTALVEAQSLAERICRPELASACSSARERLGRASAQNVRAYVRRTVVGVAARVAYG